MQTGRRRRRKSSPLSHHVCGCYCDISGLEDQLETVSTATKQPDAPALTTGRFLESSRSLAHTGTQLKKNTTDATDPEATTIPRAEGHPVTIPVCLCVYVCCCYSRHGKSWLSLHINDKHITINISYHWPLVFFCLYWGIQNQGTELHDLIITI